jgi:hypothetical protein
MSRPLGMKWANRIPRADSTCDAEKEQVMCARISMRRPLDGGVISVYHLEMKKWLGRKSRVLLQCLLLATSMAAFGAECDCTFYTSGGCLLTNAGSTRTSPTMLRSVRLRVVPINTLMVAVSTHRT